MFLVLIKIILLPLLAPLSVGMVRKVKAFTQNRKGASIIQPYFDLWKLFHKDEVISKDRSWIFLVSPYIIFGISVLLMGAIPIFGSLEMSQSIGDFLVVIYLVATSIFFLALVGIDVGSAFGGFGSSREMTLSALTEGVLLFSLLPIAILTHTTNLILMARMSSGFLPLGSYFSLLTAFFAYLIALFSETGRIPFDNAATHLELTMIHEAMILEYSGKRLALIEWANANKLFFFVLLGVTIFFPSDTIITSAMSLVLLCIITFIKVTLLLLIIAGIESSLAKYRLFRLPDILLTGFIFGIIALVATFV